MFQVGERIGDYEILQILGAGGMGQVYKVRNLLSDRIEAMKVLLPELVSDSLLADRFLREIKVQASLVHKNIAQLYTARREGDQLLMLLEFVDGLTLDALQRRGPLNTNSLVSLFGQVLDALAFAHSHGVVHRDIKPQNIMVRPDGTAKLMDFGIARVSQDQRLTQTGRTLGSLYYMSPEQIRGSEDVDGRSDLYSLGITLYEAATGSRPFDGSSDYSIMAAHLQSSATPPINLDKRLPQALSDVVMMALEKDREQRFQSAAAFKAALQNVISDSGKGSVSSTLIAPCVAPPPLPAHPPSQPPPLSSMETPVLPVPPPIVTPPPPPPPPTGSNAGMLMGVGALTIAAIAGIGYWQYPKLFPSTAASVAEKANPATTSKVPPVTIPEAASATTTKPDSAQPPETTGTSSSKLPASITEPAAKPGPGTSPEHRTATRVPAVERKQDSKRAKEPVQVADANPGIQPPLVEPKRTVESPPIIPEPPMDPVLMRQMQQLRQRYNHLNFVLSTCKQSLDAIEARDHGLPANLKESNRIARERMREVQTALRARDVDAARQNLDLAERSVESLVKALGR
jgi:eukaryotic-like serine/threonine-protein kinase